MNPIWPSPGRYADRMTSEEQPTPTAAPPDLPEVAPAGTPGERARALLRLRPYRRLWVTQLIGGTRRPAGVPGPAAAHGGRRGRGRAVRRRLPRGRVRRGAGLRRPAGRDPALRAVLLGPLHSLLSSRLDRRWTLIGADGLRAVLIGVAPWWFGWLGGSVATSALLRLGLRGRRRRACLGGRQGRHHAGCCCRRSTPTPRRPSSGRPPRSCRPSAPWTCAPAGPPFRSPRSRWSASPCSTTSSRRSARSG